ncbi:hypothetical protein [Streptomyces longwoodensis]|uniref:hypothetical protein n=1 Tax=Streptomyces longwoodensis TaxID=68231 RepID=UPI0036F7BA05
MVVQPGCLPQVGWTTRKRRVTGLVETVGVVSTVVAVIGAGALILGHVFDMFVALSDKAVRAIKAWRRVRDELRKK